MSKNAYRFGNNKPELKIQTIKEINLEIDNSGVYSKVKRIRPVVAALSLRVH
jgi:hypothetical protein